MKRMRSGPAVRSGCRILILLPTDETRTLDLLAAASADLLCQLDDNSLGAADVAEPVAVLVAPQLADKLSAAGTQAGDDGVDVFNGECDMADARCVRRRGPVGAL